MDELCLLSASELARGVARRGLTPAEVPDALPAQISRHEPKLSVWAYLDVDAARAEARALTEEAAAGRLRGPLHGVPIGIKDIYAVAGMPTRAGSGWYHEIPGRDSRTVARLRAAGALIL